MLRQAGARVLVTTRRYADENLGEVVVFADEPVADDPVPWADPVLDPENGPPPRHPGGGAGHRPHPRGHPRRSRRRRDRPRGHGVRRTARPVRRAALRLGSRGLLGPASRHRYRHGGRAVMRLTTVVAAGAAAGLAGAEEAQLRTGELSAWPSAPTTGPVAGGDRAGRAARLVEAGSAVLLRPPRLWRQSGLAQRAGTGARRPRGPRFPTEQRPEPIVDYGESLGCAGVAESALGEPARGVAAAVAVHRPGRGRRAAGRGTGNGPQPPDPPGRAAGDRRGDVTVPQ
ncbi:MAG: hypothetical protein QOI78_4849 [Actinomycetota bacterium]|nr:hypothetical protein [Actinomycetota bacterium]